MATFFEGRARAAQFRQNQAALGAAAKRQKGLDEKNEVWKRIEFLKSIKQDRQAVDLYNSAFHSPKVLGRKLDPDNPDSIRKVDALGKTWNAVQEGKLSKANAKEVIHSLADFSDGVQFQDPQAQQAGSLAQAAQLQNLQAEDPTQFQTIQQGAQQFPGVVPSVPQARREALVGAGEAGAEILKGEAIGKDGAKQFAPQVETSNLPVPGDQNKFQKVVIDRTTGESKPVLDAKGNPVFLNEKQVLLSEGKKAQSLIEPFETKFLGELGKSEAGRITALRTAAQDSVNSKQIIAEARQLLDQGIYTGSAANIRKTFDKLLQEGNIFVGGRKAANTEAYASMMGLQVGKIIKQFGAGTGLSDADREYAEKIVGGRVTLTEDAIRRLLDINDRLADFTISEFNSQAVKARQALETRNYLQPITVPQFSQPTQSGVRKFNPATGKIE